MTDSLRDRIAAVLLPDLEDAAAYNPTTESPEDWAAALADSVIRELNFSRDRVGTWARYVTEWQDTRAEYCNRCGIPHQSGCLRKTNE